MLSRRHRFHGHASLGAVYRRGLTVRNKDMALKYFRNERRSEYRAAVIVSRKVHKSAVKRNRVRRRLYEIIRTHVPADMPYDFVLTVFNEQIIDTPPTQLQHMVQMLLRKARVNASHMPTPQQHDIVNAREDDR